MWLCAAILAVLAHRGFYGVPFYGVYGNAHADWPLLYCTVVESNDTTASYIEQAEMFQKH